MQWVYSFSVLTINEEIAKSHILKFHNWIDWEIGSFFDHSIAENKKPLHIILRRKQWAKFMQVKKSLSKGLLWSMADSHAALTTPDSKSASPADFVGNLCRP